MSDTLRLGTTSRKLDADAIRLGVEKECPWRAGLYVSVLPAATYNPRFRKAVQNTATERVKEQAKKPRKSVDAAQDDAMADVTSRYDNPDFVAAALVGGMRGVYDAEGKEVEMTDALILAVLSDPGNADVLQWIAGEAMSYGQFYTADVEKDAGNSSNGSGGKKAGAGRSRRTRS